MKQEETQNKSPYLGWKLAQFLVPLILMPLLTISFNKAIEADKRKRLRVEEQERIMDTYSHTYREDINRDGLPDIVVGSRISQSEETTIWYNQGSDIYKRRR